MIVLRLADPLDPQQLPRKVLALAPSAGAAWHPGRTLRGPGPRAPRVPGERVLAQGRQVLRELAPPGGRERRGHAHVVQRPRRVVEAGEQRPDEPTRALAVPA